MVTARSGHPDCPGKQNGTGGGTAGGARDIQWISDAELVRLAESGMPLRDIAEHNYQQTGDRPTVSGVSNRLRLRGYRRRRADPDGPLLPFPVAPQHNNSRWRYMAQAYMLQRRGGKLNADQQRKVRQLYHIVVDHDLVACYSRRRGWYLRDRTDEDTEFVQGAEEETPE